MKQRGKPFQPGQSGNINGRPSLPQELKKAMQMNRVDFQELLIKYLSYSPQELAVAQSSKDTKALDRIVIAVIINAINKGDQQRLDFLLNRIIGKVREQVDHTSNGESMKAVLVLPSNGRELNDRD